MFADEALSDDRFLGGQLRLLQPHKGYRAATDPVFLAAACAAQPRQSVLDIGCGAGAAALCLGARVGGLDLVGLELQPSYADLARRNAARNGISFSPYEGDILSMPPDLRILYDHVITNPPYYALDSTLSPDSGRALAMHAHVALQAWVVCAARRLRSKGWLTLVCLSAGLPEVLQGGAEGGLGSFAILPLQARVGRAADRILVRARKGGRAPLRLLAPFIIHRGLSHGGDRESYTPEATAILREGGGLLERFA